MVKEVDDQPLFNSISEHVYHISKWYDKLLHLPPLNRHCKEHPDLSSPTEVDEIRPTLFFCSHQFQTLSFSAQFIYREKEKKIVHVRPYETIKTGHSTENRANLITDSQMKN